MDKNMLSEYAKLMVKVGANVQKGQKVRLYAEVDQYELATLVAKECYNAGASYVEMFWSCGAVERLHYENASVETLGTVLSWEEERQKQMVKDLPARIFIESADPDELSGIPADVISTVGRMPLHPNGQRRCSRTMTAIPQWKNSGTQFSPAFILTAIKTGSRCGNSIPIL